MNRPESVLRPGWGSELIHDAGFDDVVGAGADSVLPLQQVEFVLHVGRHVGVEAVIQRQIQVFDQIGVANAGQVAAARLQVGQRGRNAGIEVILRDRLNSVRAGRSRRSDRRRRRSCSRYARSLPPGRGCPGRISAPGSRPGRDRRQPGRSAVAPACAQSWRRRRQR